MCQPDLTCANGVANGGNSFPEQTFPSPRTGVSSLGFVHPDTRWPTRGQKDLLQPNVWCQCSIGAA